MRYEVVWSQFSEQQIDDIFDFYLQKSKSVDVALKIITKLLSAPNRLIENPRIGEKEILLENRQTEYHYLVESNFKIIYSINDENMLIQIADVFDCRQNPTKIERQK